MVMEAGVARRARRRFLGSVFLLVVAIVVLWRIKSVPSRNIQMQVENIVIKSGELEEDNRVAQGIGSVEANNDIREPIDNFAPVQSLPALSLGVPASEEIDLLIKKLSQSKSESVQSLSGRVYFVQVAALSNLEKAEEVKLDLARVGVVSNITGVDTSKGRVYRVRLGPFNSEVEARLNLETANNIGIYGSVIFQQ